MSVLTVDVGTSVIKSVVFDAEGREVAVSRIGTEVLRPQPGWAEQDMEAVWNGVVFTVRSALSHMGPDTEPVWLVAFTAQGDGCWLVDDDGRPTGPAVLWSDGRTGDLLARWQSDGVLEQAYRRNGSLTCTGMPNAVLTWLAEHDPERLEHSRAALTAAGWLFLKLTGVTAIDASDASAPFLDHATGDYDPEIVDLFELSWARRLLPRVLGHDECIAEITRHAAGELGLPAGLPVVMAPYDIAATARGVGVVDPGQACAILGTTLCTEVVRPNVDTSGEPSGINIAFGGPDRLLRALPTLSGTEVLDWACRTLAVEGPAALGDLASASRPGAAGLGFLPYLSPAGERAPFLDPRARGTFWGLSLDHTPADMARAVFEGLSLVVRDCLRASATEVHELRLCGGGATSDRWCRLIADTTGVPTARSTDTELGAKGAFLTGLVLTGAEKDLRQAAAKYVRMGSSWEPDPIRAALYDELSAAHLAWRDAARSLGWSPLRTPTPPPATAEQPPAHPLREHRGPPPRHLLPPPAATTPVRKTRMPDALSPDAVHLGLDLGTQSVRAIAMDGTGQLLAAASRPLTSHRDGLRHEQDPDQWWSALSDACREALDGIDTRRVRGLAVDATSGTILLADPSGTPLTPALMYDDGRAARHAERVNTVGAAVWEKLGYRTMQPSWALPKLLWLLQHTEAPRGTRLLHQADLITWRLTGRRTPTDSSHALKTGYDLLAERWPVEELTALGVPDDLLPDVVRPGTVIGNVCAQAAAATGIPPGVPVVAGMTDGCAAQIGAGALTPGAWNSVLGTTLVLKGASLRPVHDPAGVVYCHLGPGGTWLPGGASSSGAGVLSRRFPGADLDALTEQAATTDSTAVVYPLAGARGERFPFRAPDAHSFVLGEPTGTAEEFHACLLGVACLERLCLDHLDHIGAPVDGPLSLTGGGARNRYWSQLRADLLGRRVTLPEQAESAAGMAVLAATACGVPLEQAAAAMVRSGTELHPDSSRTRRLLPRYLGFVDELTRRGWLDPQVATHAHRKAQQ
ncbi:FGGY family carbohydrate kinase [Streptomyces sp. M41]|uniref:FGGY family carbohydrate kinase n=1 Tax=Streptomyces sp. M41 TaxID=3059412 RepID=UPI00374CBC40